MLICVEKNDINPEPNFKEIKSLHQKSQKLSLNYQITTVKIPELYAHNKNTILLRNTCSQTRAVQRGGQRGQFALGPRLIGGPKMKKGEIN